MYDDDLWSIADISIHALRKESDESAESKCLLKYISIHALRKESDFPPRNSGWTGTDFNPRSP